MTGLVVGSGAVYRDVCKWIYEHNIHTVHCMDRTSPDIWQEVAGAEWVYLVTDAPTGETKRLLGKCLSHRVPGTLVLVDSSITPIRDLVTAQELPSDLALLHLFVPLQHLSLAEICANGETAERAEFLAKSVFKRQTLRCSDRSGFVANRMALSLSALTIWSGWARELPPSSCDATFKAVTGSKAGPFLLWDLLGHNAFVSLVQDLYSGGPSIRPAKVREYECFR